ncbi:dihydrolipoyllysine-residue acetyltransferase [Chromohalobacter sp. TMW 2.2308]|uniref:Acetyltransferase component of pyruvate dehydrogenase complex n=2 Tax=Chromohalobacter TaxID=42054 RepID=A0A9X3B4P7_9GAMM|nr:MULTISPECIES: dihydrolipoyllysine-residue acetyltransferase [Chromohalobacter]MCK2041406.1 dihydrolipoyllysine-residue acetyltransferase [Chromohalobacter moromii]MCK2044347.1 dihydrolipoyllysine-residue acetyltransferase [Chromohalobacter moromii]MCT8504493.1 dihydrolipoyllysine-residue acetyltransferase [Chromohalobacter moromii]MCT8513554.1 dihydrolipoyllysine-residue acetyltransferase [Chromohalobacter sp. TMW 2.2271]
MSSEIIKVPDIGGSEGVEIIEVAVSEGDVIAPEDTMITLESDKASMDVPAPKGGKVVKVLVKEGDSVSEGDDILELEAEGGGDDAGDTSSQDEDQSQDESAEKQETAEPEKAAPKKKSTGGGKRTVEIKVPDIGGSEGVEIIEVPVSEGDEVSAEDSLITLESDKASMDVPSPYSGKLVSLAVKEGDSVSEGDLIGSMEIAGEGDDADDDTDEAPAEGDSDSAESDADTEDQDAGEDTEEGGDEGGRKELRVPDIGGSENVPIIELAISEGDEIDAEDTLITLESDKASMDVPSPYKGKVVEVSVKEGDSVSEGDLIGYIEVAGSKKPAKKADTGKKPDAGKADQKADAGQQKASTAKSTSSAKQPTGEPSPEARHKQGDDKTAGAHVHAGPAVRMLARELGVDLAQVTPTGPKNRVLKEDVQGYVKNALQQRSSGAGSSAAPAGGAGIPAVPDIDFSQFGEVEEKPMGRLMKAGAANLHRSWLNVPHVTQFDEADITELEAFRKSMKDEAAKQDAKLTPLPFMIKACAYALQKFPQFNVSLKSDGETLVQKHYVHIGIAVDTPDGLMVPVIRNADQKSLIELAKESVELAGKAQSKKLKREEMTGGCFTISSLGSIGGTAFTPIVNAPEVAILGVSKAQTKPVWDGAEFAPRLMMPLSLSYDHRAVNGADAARFTAFLAQALSDIRRLLM